MKKRLNRLSQLALPLLLITLNPIWSSAADKKACQSEEYRQFDFWIGQWNVFDNKGKQVGTNHIYPILDGCALSENWTNAKGTSGVSYNFFDNKTLKWHQTWVDQTGGALYLDGKLMGDKMVLSGPRPSKDGKITQHKITWTPLEDGRVKQHWQVSSDGSKTWKDLFIGFYHKQ